MKTSKQKHDVLTGEPIFEAMARQADGSMQKISVTAKGRRVAFTK